MDETQSYRELEIVWYHGRVAEPQLAVVTAVTDRHSDDIPAVTVRVHATGTTVATNARSLSPYDESPVYTREQVDAAVNRAVEQTAQVWAKRLREAK